MGYLLNKFYKAAGLTTASLIPGSNLAFEYARVKAEEKIALAKTDYQRYFDVRRTRYLNAGFNEVTGDVLIGVGLANLYEQFQTDNAFYQLVGIGCVLYGMAKKISWNNIALKVKAEKEAELEEMVEPHRPLKDKVEELDAKLSL